MRQPEAASVPSHPYRVWHIPQVPMDAFYVHVADLDTAALVIEVLAEYDKFQFEKRVKPDYCNVSGVDAWDDRDGWESVDEDDLPSLAARVEWSEASSK